MKPLLSIAKKEIMIALREKLVISLAAIILLLLGIATYAGFISYDQQQHTISETQAQKRQEWLNQGDKHPHIAAHYGTFVFKPKTILSIFDFGLDTYTGTSVYLEAHNQHEFMFRPAQDHSSMIRFGELSAALVLQVLLPLLIIFLAFASFTQERESGTLKLLLSQGVSLGALIWGKILGYCLIIIAILAPFLLGVFILTISGIESSIIPDVVTRVLLIVLFYGLYLFLFVALAVWVSLKSSTGRNSLLSLLACWIFLTVLVPKTVANLSETFYSLPSMRVFRAEIEEDITNGLDGKSTRSVRLTNLQKEYLTKYKADSLKHLPVNFDGISQQAGEDYGNKVYDHHLEKLRNVFHRQNRLSSILSLLNPYLAIQHLSMGLSASDIYTSIDFEEQVEVYRRNLVRRMNKDMAENSQYGEFYGYKAKDDLWLEIEDFSYSSPTAIRTLRHYQWEIASLLLWVFLTLVLLQYTNRKIKPFNG